MKTKLTSLYCILFSILFTCSAAAQLAEPDASDAQTEMTQEEQDYQAWAQSVWESLTPITGNITLANDAATLNVPEEFYFLNSSDAKTVLTDVWGNPPESAQGVLGMLFPADYTPFDDGAWGVTIEYEQDGYVSDDDAADIDYDDMLADMQSGVRDASHQRVEQGYPSIELVGWAAQPYYDESTHKLYWAKEIQFGDAPENTLNYNIRVLGRKGVLVMNFIAGMSQLDQINGELDSVLAMANFNDGSKYSDFNPDLDDVAAYGLGALVAGKVAAKVGLFATALLFLKKFWFVLVLGFGAIAKFFKPKAAKSE